MQDDFIIFLDKLPIQIDYTSRINRTFRTRFYKTFVSSDFDSDEFTILYLLSNDPNTSQIMMGKILYKGKAHVGKILSKMEAQGLITRTKDSKRIIHNTITPKGKELFEFGVKQFESILDKSIQQNFSEEELRQFTYLLSKYRDLVTSIIDVKLK